MKNLLTLKSIITIMVTLVFCYLSIIGVIDAEKFMTIFGVIIAFYFGTQRVKDDYKYDEKVEDDYKTKTYLVGKEIED